MQTLSYFYVKYCPRVPILLLTFEKIEHKNFDFVLLSSFCFPLRIPQKVYCVYKQSAHQTNALLLEIFLFLVRAANTLKAAFLYVILCIITCTNRMISLLSKISIFLVRAVCKLLLASYGSKHITTTFSYDILCILTLVTRKLHVVCERSTYRMTVLLSEMPIFCIRAGCKIWMASYAFKHTSQSLR